MSFRPRFPWRAWIGGLALGLGLYVRAQTNSVEAEFLAANALVASGKYAEGLSRFAQLPTAGKTSAALEYNRGVAYSRLGAAGQAQAHWWLAERLAPRNPAIQAALNGPSPPANVPSTEVFAGPLAWTDRLTLNEWGVLGFTLTWLWGALLLLGRWKPVLAASLKGYTLGTGVLAIVFVGLLAGAWNRRVRLPDAVVLRPDTAIRVSPLEEARTAFSLAGGIRVRSQEARAGWFLVEDPTTRRFGWVKGDQILRLPLR